MKNPVFRIALLYAALAGGFILLDLTLDRLTGGSPRFDLLHLILAAIVVLSSFVLLSRALKARNRAEAVLRQAHDDLEIRVYERTAELQAEIAERKRVEQARQESEETLRALMNASPESAMLLDTQGLILAVNETAAQRLGVTVDRMMGSSVFDFFSWQVADGRRAYLDQVLRTGRHAFFEDERDGRLFDIYAHPVCDADGKTIKVAVFGHDMTERKQVERALRVANERLEMAQRAAGAGIWDWDITTGRIEWSLQMFELFGLDPQEATASFETWEAVLHPEDKESASARIDQALKERTLLVNEYRIGRPDGQIRWINALGQGAYDDQGRAVRMAGICIDITERKRSEAAQRMKDNAIESSINAIAFSDLEGNLTYVNASFLKLWGYTDTIEVLGRPAIEFWQAPEKALAIVEALRDRGSWMGELVAKRKDGSTFDVQLSASVVTDETRKPTGMMASFVDITERKRAEEELRETRDYLENLFNYANAPIIVWDPEFRITRFNHAFEHLTGRGAAEVLGQQLDLLFPAGRRDEALGHIRRAVAGERWEVVEIPILRVDDTVRTVLWNSATLYAPDGMTAIATIAQGQDITERKQAEEQRERLLAMEERQRLARELHDSVSQALYGISLGAHTALTLFDTDRAKVLEALNFVLSLTQAGLTEMRALIFELRPESLALEGLVVALGKHVAALRARHGIEVELALCDEPDAPLPVKEAIYRIAQEALQNAVKHSRSERLDVRLSCDAESLGLDVCDNGVGFDPLASYPGHLGLRSMRERASSVGGTLEIESVPGCGTRIRAHAPIRAVELAPSP